jgi:microcystin degradation protein MlrC
MTLRLAVGGLSHETNALATSILGLTTVEHFDITRGDEIIERYAGTRTYMGGILDAAHEINAEVVPVFHAVTAPSGTIAAEAYEAMRDELVEGIARAMPVDAVALELHGAGEAQNAPDLEADLCRAIRERVGPDVKIVAPLDLHGNITPGMAEVIDAMFGVHCYPHTDMYERGYEAVSIVPRLVAGLRTRTAVVDLPILLPSSPTTRYPAARVNELCAALEARPGVIDVTFFHGFACTDSPHVGVHIVATTEDDDALAQACATEIATWIWEHRDDFRNEVYTPEAAIDLALATIATVAADTTGTGPVVINDAADNPDGGAPGDATHLLRAMVEAKLERACFGFVYDPAVVQQAQAAGVGATIDVSLGGKHDDIHGRPVELRAYVKCLTDGRFVLQAMFAGLEVDLGPTCRLQADGLDIIVVSRRAQTFDPEVFKLHGIDVLAQDIVALKSSNHFRAGFEPIARAIVTADSPGLSTTTRWEMFERARSPEKLWPRDDDTTWPA